MIDVMLGMLRSDGYITVNKTLARNIGLVPATIFSELCSKYAFFKNNNTLQDGYFYCTIPDLEKNTGLTKDEQSTAVNKLIKFGLIEKKVKKLKGDEAPKRYFKVVEDVTILIKYLKDVANNGFEENTISTIGNSEIDIVNPDTNKNNSIIINNENKSIHQSNETPKLIDPKPKTKTDGLTESFSNPEDDKTIERILQNGNVEMYDARLFISQVISKLWKDRELPYKLQMGLKTEDIQDRLRELKQVHIDSAIAKMQGCKKNKQLYFMKCLLTAIVESPFNFEDEEDID